MSDFVFPKNPEECPSLSVDDTKEYLNRETEAEGNPIKQIEMNQWVIETAYDAETYQQVKGKNRDATTLAAMIARSTFGLRDEIKNFMRSGDGEPTRTE